MGGARSKARGQLAGRGELLSDARIADSGTHTTVAVGYPLAIQTKKQPSDKKAALSWATWIRTKNDRTRICSVTITP